MNIMRVTVPSGQTSWIQYIALQDASGEPVTGLSYLGMTAWYVRDKASPVEISVVTQTVTGVFSSGGLVEVDGSNLPGVYRFDIPNAVFTYGVNNVMLVMQNASMQQFCMYIQLDPPANVTQIIGNATGGTNLKDFAVNGYDATNHRAYADATAINGNATAADNLKTFANNCYAPATNLVYADVQRLGSSGVAAANLQDFTVNGYDTTNHRAFADVVAISGDAPAADNAEKVFDNTGYNMSASTIGAATAVTNTVAADVVSISGDVAAADNAEKVFDNTGYNMSNSTLGTVTAVTTVTTVATVTNVTNGVDLSAAAVDAIWDESLTAHTTINTPGAAMNGIEHGAATSTTLSTTQMSTNLSIAVNDHYKDRVLIWISGSLKRQAVSITAYNGATKTLTFTAATSAPSNGDKFIIV